MDDNFEMEYSQTAINTPKVYRYRKKRGYDQALCNLSSQLTQLSFHQKKLRINSNNDCISDYQKEEDKNPKEDDVKGDKEIKEVNDPVIKIDMELEKKLVSEYYKKQNKLLNKLMFSFNGTEDETN